MAGKSHTGDTANEGQVGDDEKKKNPKLGGGGIFRAFLSSWIKEGGIAVSHSRLGQLGKL